MVSVRIQTMIVEDEPLARDGLLLYIKEVDFLEVRSICEDGSQAHRVLAEQPIDLMFLDIQMPKMTGIEFLKSMKQPPLVIMTTAYPNFALQGFELDVVDYLVKPYPLDRFLKAANKAKEWFDLLNQQRISPEEPVEDYFFVKCDYRFEKIFYRDVQFVEGMENYLVIHTETQKYITLLRMKAIEETLPSKDFLRIHKSYIVSVRAIKAIDGNDVIVGGKRLPISRDKKNEILERLVRN